MPVLNQRHWAADTGWHERKDSVSSAVLSKGVNALSNRNPARQRKSPWTPRLLPTYVKSWKQLRSKSKWKKKKNMSKKVRQQRREHTVGNRPLAMKMAEKFLSFLNLFSFYAFKDHSKGSLLLLDWVHNLHFTQQQKQHVTTSHSESCDTERKH